MQRLVEIGDQVVGIFKPNRQPNQFLANAGHLKRRGVHLLVCGRCRWITSDLASPTLARCENRPNRSINTRPASTALVEGKITRSLWQQFRSQVLVRVIVTFGPC